MNEDLILGYTWEAIQRAQRGGRLNDRVINTAKPAIPDATADDRALLEKHGAQGLEAIGYHGVISRLKQSGLI